MSHTFSFSPETVYKQLPLYMDGLLYGEPDLIANLSNASSLINLALHDVLWVGFYMMKDGELVLGPFQGKPACIRIKLGKGVCGTSAEKDQTLLVPNVDEFPGHIACDGDSRSEIVIPIHKDGKVIGVLDIDSGSLNRFNDDDKNGLEEVVKIIEKHI